MYENILGALVLREQLDLISALVSWETKEWKDSCEPSSKSGGEVFH